MISQAEYQKSRYYRLKAAGLCVRCGCRPAAPGKTQCEACLIKIREYSKRRYRNGGKCDGNCDSCKYDDCIADTRIATKRLSWIRRRREDRTARGLCAYCGERPADPGLRSCAACRVRNAEIRNAMREKRRAAGLCTRCGKKPPTPGYSWCLECQVRRRLYARANWTARKERMEGTR